MLAPPPSTHRWPHDVGHMEQYCLHGAVGSVAGRGGGVDLPVGLEEEVDVSEQAVNIDVGEELGKIPCHLPKTLDRGTTEIVTMETPLPSPLCAGTFIVISVSLVEDPSGPSECIKTWSSELRCVNEREALIRVRDTNKGEGH